MAYCRKGTYTEATDEEIANNKAEKTEKSIYISHGSYPVANNDL
ncbi:22078_t:CDS:1, partial [Gigaspora rosea]